MLYRVLAEGIDILDYDTFDLVLKDPEVNLEVDTAGSFQFTVPYEHRYYNMFTSDSIMALTIEVLEGDILHFIGRPIEFQLTMDKDKVIVCEGALAYFNDSVIDNAEFEDTELSTIFGYVIGSHNGLAANNRRIEMGSFTVTDRLVYRKFDFEQTLDALKSKFLDAEDGHFFIRKETDGNLYLDFLKDFPYTCAQQVIFGQNLRDLNYSFNGGDYATCVIPLGANDDDGYPITIRSVNNDSIILEGPAVENYGRIIKVQNYGDIKDPYILLKEGQEYLTRQQTNVEIVECSAIDLHSINNNIEPFRLGQKVTCISEPHGISTELPISKIRILLDRAEKEITLGRMPKKTLARFYKTKSDGSGGDYGGSDIPYGWQLEPGDDGGTPTMRKIPTNIVINTPPNQTQYNYGDSINFSGLSIRLLTPASNGEVLETFIDPENYPTGIVEYPSEELNLPMTTVDQNTTSIKVPVGWRSPYDAKIMVAYFTITNLTQKAIDDAHGGLPDRIEAYVEKIGGVDPQVYKDGDSIHKNGVKVYAYWPNGEPYDDNGYVAGYIPNSEWTFKPKIARYDQGQIYPSGGVVSTGGVDPNNVQPNHDHQGHDEINTITFSRAGIYYIGVMQPNGYMNLVAVSTEGTFSYECHGICNGKQTDHSVGSAGRSTYSGQTIWSVVLGAWHSPLPTPSIPTVPIGSGNARSAGLLALLGPDLDPGQNAVTVYWKRPGDNKVLSTYFLITVRESSGGGGR